MRYFATFVPTLYTPCMRHFLNTILTHIWQARFALTAAFFGSAIFITYWGWQIDPTNISWILSAGRDLATHYFGWAFFREASFAWPLGLAPSMAYPIGAPLALTDSIPLAAFLLRPFSSLLPAPFQYLGLWGLLSLTLQGFFGYIIAKRWLGTNMRAVVASTFFVLAPPLLSRVGMHTALTAHWLILAALWLTLSKQKHTKKWICLTLLASLVHPYLALMTVGTALLAAIQQRHWQIFAYSVITMSIVAGSIGLLQGTTTAGGYGLITLNLTAPLNPMGWSTVLPSYPVGPFQFEGLIYPGLGMVLLTIYLLGQKKTWSQLSHLMTTHKILLLGSVFVTLLAISHNVWLGDRIILSLPIPTVITANILGIVRASGRLMLPVYYLALCSVIYLLSRQRPRTQAILLGLALLIQLIDLSAPLHEANARAVTTWDTPLQDQLWNERSDASHLWLAPPLVTTNTIDHFEGAGYEPLAHYALTHDMTFNTGYFARPIKGLSAANASVITEFQAGITHPDTIYVFFESPATLEDILGIEQSKMRYVDGFSIYVGETPFSSTGTSDR